MFLRGATAATAAPRRKAGGVALQHSATHVVAFVILATTIFQSLVLFDAVLIVSILGFVSTVATAQYIARRGTAT